jgi:hypothetical protein
MEKSDGETPLGRRRGRWNDNIKWMLKKRMELYRMN